MLTGTRIRSQLEIIDFNNSLQLRSAYFYTNENVCNYSSSSRDQGRYHEEIGKFRFRTVSIEVGHTLTHF